MQHRNRLGSLWLAGIELSPGRGTLPRVYIGTEFPKLSAAGVSYFSGVAASVSGIVGVSDASGNDMLGNGTGFILALQQTEASEAMDGDGKAGNTAEQQARNVTNQFLDRLHEGLEGMSSQEAVDALIQRTIIPIEEVMACHSSGSGVHMQSE